MPILKLTGHPHWFDAENVRFSRNARYFSANVIFPDDDSIWSGAYFVEPDVELGVFENPTISLHFMPNADVEEHLRKNSWFYMAKGPIKIGRFDLVDMEYCQDDWKPVGIF
ncbi:MAG: hypothetical protein HY014_18455 [Acidobacteria bacterium]|nr:hypothetical protein [Acidobacteriota bacterium]MBI3490121.1 hypothetical protein [Acidobacteriota bacterium]